MEVLILVEKIMLPKEEQERLKGLEEEEERLRGEIERAEATGIDVTKMRESFEESSRLRARMLEEYAD